MDARAAQSIAKLSTLRHLLVATAAPSTSRLVQRRERVHPRSAPFRVPSSVVSAPSLCSIPFSDIIAHSVLPLFTAGERVNSRNKVERFFQKLVSANISGGVSMQYTIEIQFFRTIRSVRNPSSRGVNYNSGRRCEIFHSQLNKFAWTCKSDNVSRTRSILLEDFSLQFNFKVRVTLQYCKRDATMETRHFLCRCLFKLPKKIHRDATEIKEISRLKKLK